MNPAITESIEAAVNAFNRPHPLRIGIDGMSASGKTRFADRLAQSLQRPDRPVIRTSIDGFHNPPEIRHRRGGNCPVGYVEDSFDKPAVIKELLGPLGPKGNLKYKLSQFDFVSNQQTQASTQTASPNALLIFDGVLLFCDQLASHFDLRIFIATDESVSLERGVARDHKRLGGSDAASRKYTSRYLPGQREYQKRNCPQDSAHLVVDNNDFLNPKIVVNRLSEV